ncbi:DUF6516 family protein (plasmid) [Halorutilales archaeon Cl-col2-1]
MVEVLLNDEDKKPDGTKIEAIGYEVPRSDQFPEGVKYSFVYFHPDDDVNILRYDNAHEHAGSKHHKHVRGETHPVDYEGSVEQQYEKFLNEVEEIYEHE